MCGGLSKISSNFALHLIKVGKLKRFKKVSSDLKTILMTDLADLRFPELWERRNMSINLNYAACENSLKLTWSKKIRLCVKLYFTWSNYCALHKHANSEVQKPTNDCVFPTCTGRANSLKICNIRILPQRKTLPQITVLN